MICSFAQPWLGLFLLPACAWRHRRGVGYELVKNVAVVTEWTSLFGGAGGIGKTIAGVVLLGFLSTCWYCRPVL
ncbi:MAG: GlyGly-CTERM sorting domain-containing protein [Terriglobia bacterium]